MHENTPVLKGEVRERLGSRYSKRLRENGRLPIVVYGHGEGPAPISVDAKETIKYIESGERVFTLDLGGKTETVLLRDVQFDYLGDGIIHADLARVDLDETTHANVHVRLKGDAVGLKSDDTLLMHPVSELEVECKLRDLPDEIVVNISELDAGDSITAGDVELPSGVTLLSDPDDVLATIVTSQGEAESAEESEVESSAEPEVIKAKPEDEAKDGE